MAKRIRRLKQTRVRSFWIKKRNVAKDNEGVPVISFGEPVEVKGEVWPATSKRQQKLREFCHTHNDYCDYEPLITKMDDEEMANMALTLCHQTDKMMCAYIEKLEKKFVTEGGIKERMHAARTGYRQEVDARLKALEEENQRLKKENEELKKRLGGIGRPRQS